MTQIYNASALVYSINQSAQALAVTSSETPSFYEGINQSTWREPRDVMTATLTVFFISPVIIVTNAILVLSIYRFKRLRTPSNIFLLSLFSSHLGVGAMLPLTLYFELSRSLPGGAPSQVCPLPYALLVHLSGVGMLSSTAVALDRCASLALPLTYNNLLSHRTASRTVMLIWFYSALASAIPVALLLLFSDDFSGTECGFSAQFRTPLRIFLLCSYYVPSLLTMGGCYCYVYIVARRHARAIYSVEGSLRAAFPDIQRHYGWTLVFTVGVFMLLWTPIVVVMIWDIIQPEKELMSSQWAFYAGLLGLSSGAVDPLLYGFRNAEFRAALLKLLRQILPSMAQQFLGTMTVNGMNGFESSCTINNLQPVGGKKNKMFDATKMPEIFVQDENGDINNSFANNINCMTRDDISRTEIVIDIGRTATYV